MSPGRSRWRSTSGRPLRSDQDGRIRLVRIRLVRVTELDVVRLVAQHLTNPEIAERLFVSRATVKTHLLHIFTRLNVTSRSQLAAEATRHGVEQRNFDRALVGDRGEGRLGTLRPTRRRKAGDG